MAPFTVGGWNVGLDDADPQVIAETLADFEGVDLWGLAEVNPQAGVVDLFAGAAESGEAGDFTPVLGSSGDNIRLLALYDDSRFELVGTEQLDAVNTTGNARAPLVLHLEDEASGQELLFMVNHLYRSRDEERLRQAQLLAEWAAQQTLPVIAVGDYNFDWATRGGDSDHDGGYDAMTAGGVWEWVRPAELVTTQCSGWPCTYDTVLDFVFTGGPARNWPSRSVIALVPGDFPDDTRRSDHRAVLAQFAPRGEGELAGEIALAPSAMPQGLDAAERPAPVAAAAPAPSAGPLTNSDANLRAGPGQEYPILDGTVSGQALAGDLAPVGISADGQWLALANGAWIYAPLVTGAPGGLPVAAAAVQAASGVPASASEARGQAISTPNGEPTAAPVQVSAGEGVVISTIFYDGIVPDVESDEYIELLNQGAAPVNLSGWRINAGDEGQDFWLAEYPLAPGGRVRIYTNEVHSETGGLSFGSGKPVWLNKGDCGYLFDPAGAMVSEHCY
jgi:endonuclease/exonuclease/phosphatase family metal-dependent hydrolase